MYNTTNRYSLMDYVERIETLERSVTDLILHIQELDNIIRLMNTSAFPSRLWPELPYEVTCNTEGS